MASPQPQATTSYSVPTVIDWRFGTGRRIESTNEFVHDLIRGPWFSLPEIGLAPQVIGLAIDDDGTQSALMHGFTLRFVRGIS